jgi:hypothetical protein
MSKDNFKRFIFNHPEFIDYVKNNNTSWQSLYELYDIYGEDMSIWNKYITKTNDLPNISSLLNTLKNINLDSLEENISSIQKAVDIVSELTKKDNTEEVKPKESNIDSLYGDKNEE